MCNTNLRPLAAVRVKHRKSLLTVSNSFDSIDHELFEHDCKFNCNFSMKRIIRYSKARARPKHAIRQEYCLFVLSNIEPTNMLNKHAYYECRDSWSSLRFNATIKIPKWREKKKNPNRSNWKQNPPSSLCFSSYWFTTVWRQHQHANHSSLRILYYSLCLMKRTRSTLYSHSPGTSFAAMLHGCVYVCDVCMLLLLLLCVTSVAKPIVCIYKVVRFSLRLLIP